MGIIQTQTIKGTIYSYIGVSVGFIITGILFPRLLSAEEIGLLKLLVSFSLIFAQFASLGFINVINRLFPYFRDKDSGHNGMLFIAIAVSVAGFILSMIGLELLKPMLIRNNTENSGLFVVYINYLIPLTFFTAFFNLFDAYIKALFDAVVGTALKELVQRIFILAVIVIYYLGLCDFKAFVIWYCVALSLPTVILLFILVLKGEFKLRFPPSSLIRTYRKEIIDLCIYGILIGFGGIAIIQVDSILVNRFLGLTLTGIYATNFFFATIILIPSRPLIKIATTILAEAWKREDLNEIQVIYQKSSINQAIIAILLFIGLWVNIDNVYSIIPREYETGKWVIFFVGLANVFDMLTGINAVIIQTSQYFKVNAVITFIFLLLIIVLNILFIPLIGITGAGLSAMVSVIICNTIRFYYLKIKFGLTLIQPKLLIILLLAFVAYLAGYFIPRFDSFIIDIAVRSFVCGGVFIASVLIFRISDEINSIFSGMMNFILPGRK